MMAEQEQADISLQLDDGDSRAVRRFKTIVETALSGAPDMQALAQQIVGGASAEMPFKELPGDALSILRVLKSGGTLPSAEEIDAAILGIERVRRNFDLKLMLLKVSETAAISGLMSPHSAPGFEPTSTVLAKTADGIVFAADGGSGAATFANVGMGRTNPSGRPTSIIPDTPLASPPFMAGTIGGPPEQSSSQDLSFGGANQPTSSQTQSLIAAITSAVLEATGRQIAAQLQEHTRVLEEKFSGALDQSRSIPAQEGASSSADPRRGGGDGGNQAPDLSGVGQALYEGVDVSFGSEGSEEPKCADSITIVRENPSAKDLHHIGTLGTHASEQLTQLAENLIRLFLKPTTPAAEILEAKRALSTGAAEGVGLGGNNNCVLGPNGISLQVSLLSSIRNDSIPTGENFLRQRPGSQGGDLRGLTRMSPVSVLVMRWARQSRRSCPRLASSSWRKAVKAQAGALDMRK